MFVEVAIIGAGPAGIAAALQLKRSGLEPLLLEQARVGGLLWNANLVENYPGFPQGIRGADLVRLFAEHLKNVGVGVCSEAVRQLHYDGHSFIIETDKRKIAAQIVVLASGTKPREFTDCPIPEEARERVFYEVYPLRAFKQKRIAIVGAGDAAFDYALQLAENENEVFIINRGDQIKSLPLLWERAQSKPSIKYQAHTEIIKITAEKSLILDLSAPKKSWTLLVDAVIFAIGRVPQLDYCAERLSKESPALERAGLLYLIGDVRRGIYRQTALAVGDGIETAMRISEKLKIQKERT